MLHLHVFVMLVSTVPGFEKKNKSQQQVGVQLAVKLVSRLQVVENTTTDSTFKPKGKVIRREPTEHHINCRINWEA